MKTITIDLPDAVYSHLQDSARLRAWSLPDYVIEALSRWKPATTGTKASLRQRSTPHHAGGIVQPLTLDDDLLEEMRDDSRG